MLMRGFLFVGVCAVLFGVVMPVVPAYAQSACTCFCESADGAKQISKTPMDSSACTSQCEISGSRVAVCASSPAQFPSNNALCFQADQCAKQDGVLANYQAPACIKGWTHCFPNPEKNKVKLNVPFGDLETVGDLGVYIEAFYKWILRFAVVVSIILIMIGGVQWTLGSVSQDQLSKAKNRIKNGLIGLVLLMSAVLILQMVNPQLLRLHVPRPSLLRPVDLTKLSCEKLADQNHQVEPATGGKEECGNFGVVTFLPSGEPAPDGWSCQYEKCAKGGCVAQGLDQPGVCMECRYISAGNPNSGPATQSVCNAVAPIKQGQTQHCKFASGGGGSTIGFSSGYNAIKTYASLGSSISPSSVTVSLSDDACVEYSVSCPQNGDCDTYDKIQASYWDDDEVKSNDLYDISPIWSQAICKEDICGYAGGKCDWGEILGCSNP